MYMKYGGFLIPFTIIVRCFYTKSVIPCWQIGVRNKADIILLIPYIIISLQFVGKCIMFTRYIIGNDKRNGE